MTPRTLEEIVESGDSYRSKAEECLEDHSPIKMQAAQVFANLAVAEQLSLIGNTPIRVKRVI